MSRIAILVESSRLKDHQDLPGARLDVARYQSYLKSDFGGAWEDSEITTLSQPTRKNILDWVAYAATKEYAFIAYSGHGHHVLGKRISETPLCINDSEEVSVFELNPGNPRCLIVADACRKVTRLIEVEKMAKSFQMSIRESEARLRPNRQRCRATFDEGLERSERGAIYMYSCDLDEAASDSDSFSGFLVDAGEAWADQQKAGMQRSDASFAAASAATTRVNKQQHPQQDGGRRMAHFPFAVLAY